MPTIFKEDVIEQAFTMAELYAMSKADRQRYQNELKHLTASGIPADQVRRLLGLERDDGPGQRPP